MYKFFISFILLSILFFSCSDYNKVLKSDDFQKKFTMANDLYDAESFPKAVSLYEQVYQYSPKSDMGEVAYYRLAKCYYQDQDYYMAGYYFNAFMQRFPYSVKNEDCLFMLAMCSVKNSPKYTLDQEETEYAINNIQQFVNRYPNSSLIDSCNNLIDRLRFKLEYKDFETVKLYSKTEKYRAAVTSSLSFLEKYPNSTFKENAWYILINNSFLLSKNSTERKKKARISDTIERYRKFAVLYPNSKFLRELMNKEEEMIKELQLITTNQK